LYYAIKSNRVAILEYLISLGCNLEISNNKQINLVSWAQKQNKVHLKDILLKNGAPLPIDTKNSKKQA
jgi:ankyrin repeat protein